MTASRPRRTGGVLGGFTQRRDRHDRLIPMINVVFLLLTFFIITGTFRAADTIAVEPPEAVTAGVLDAGARTLYVSAAGEVAFGAEHLPMDAAIDRIRQLRRDEPEAEIIVKADRALPAAVILPVMRRLAEAGVTRLRLVAIKRERSEGG